MDNATRWAKPDRAGPQGSQIRLIEQRTATLGWLEAELARLRHRLEDAMQDELRREGGQEVAELLAPPEALDRLLRYEAASDRQFYQAMHHLERLQRQSRGEVVPAPLSLEVSERREAA